MSSRVHTMNAGVFSGQVDADILDLFSVIRIRVAWKRVLPGARCEHDRAGLSGHLVRQTSCAKISCPTGIFSMASAVGDRRDRDHTLLLFCDIILPVKGSLSEF